MYNKIINPKTGRKVSIYGKIGKKILNNYIKFIGGAAAAESSTEYDESERKKKHQKLFEQTLKLNKQIKEEKIQSAMDMLRPDMGPDMSENELREYAIEDALGDIHFPDDLTRTPWDDQWILSHLGEGQYLEKNGKEYAVFPGDIAWDSDKPTAE